MRQEVDILPPILLTISGETLPTVAESGLWGGGSPRWGLVIPRIGQGAIVISLSVNEMISYAIEKFLWTAIYFRFNLVALAPVAATSLL